MSEAELTQCEIEVQAEEIARLRAALAQASRCSTCGGDPHSHPSHKLCICENGTRDGEVDGLRKAVCVSDAALAQAMALLQPSTHMGTNSWLAARDAFLADPTGTAALAAIRQAVEALAAIRQAGEALAAYPEVSSLRKALAALRDVGLVP